jgi:hypothetical protein
MINKVIKKLFHFAEKSKEKDQNRFIPDLREIYKRFTAR